MSDNIARGLDRYKEVFGCVKSIEDDYGRYVTIRTNRDTEIFVRVNSTVVLDEGQDITVILKDGKPISLCGMMEAVLIY